MDSVKYVGRYVYTLWVCLQPDAEGMIFYFNLSGYVNKVLGARQIYSFYAIKQNGNVDKLSAFFSPTISTTRLADGTFLFIKGKLTRKMSLSLLAIDFGKSPAL